MRSILFFNYDPIPCKDHGRAIIEARNERAYQAALKEADRLDALDGKRPRIAMPPAKFSEAEMLEQNRAARLAEVKSQPALPAPVSSEWSCTKPPTEGEYETYMLSSGEPIDKALDYLRGRKGFRRLFKDGEWSCGNTPRFVFKDPRNKMYWRPL